MIGIPFSGLFNWIYRCFHIDYINMKSLSPVEGEPHMMSVLYKVFVNIIGYIFQIDTVHFSIFGPVTIYIEQNVGDYYKVGVLFNNITLSPTSNRMDLALFAQETSDAPLMTKMFLNMIVRLVGLLYANLVSIKSTD